MEHPQRTVLVFATSVAKHADAFQQFRQALIEAGQEANAQTRPEPGCNWEVGQLVDQGFSFTVNYIGLKLRYVLEVDAPSSIFRVVLHAIDRFDEENFSVVAAEEINARSKTQLRYVDDGDELFLNARAGAREMFLLQVGKHLGLLGQR